VIENLQATRCNARLILLESARNVHRPVAFTTQVFSS
jgi:hypothetical protein